MRRGAGFKRGGRERKVGGAGVKRRRKTKKNRRTGKNGAAAARNVRKTKRIIISRFVSKFGPRRLLPFLR